MPKTTDLSFYNWDTQVSKLSPSPNFEVGAPGALPRPVFLPNPAIRFSPCAIMMLLLQTISDQHMGLQFKCTRDRKIVNVDPALPTPGDNTTRTVLKTPEYLQAVFYDHATRRKA